MTTNAPAQSTKSATPRHALLRQHANGAIEALSQRGPEVYAVRVGDGASCTCKGWTNYGHCYHLTDAAGRFPAFYSRPQSARPAARISDLYA